MKHEGKILEKGIRNSGISIAFIANKTGYSRRHFYNLFNNETIPVDLFISVGEIINFDFSIELKKLKSFRKKIKEESDTEINHWKDKYLDLLEKYQKLLEQSKK